MRVAFYAPMKPPSHPVPSGDRQMARLLMAAIGQAGHQVYLASELRAYLPDSGDEDGLFRLRQAASAECRRLSQLWRQERAPDLWFCYHPYYKSPDLIGPALAEEFNIPWISTEASLSARRNCGIWTGNQADLAHAISRAPVNFAMTARDRDGLRAALPEASICPLPPFLDLGGGRPIASPSKSCRIVTVAMMRQGDKFDSYRAMSAALKLLPPDIDWRLAVAGDGQMRDEVQALFPRDRCDWLGELSPDRIVDFLASGALYFWPGCGEAYGLAYLEAQAAGLPVIAWSTAGVPEVVSDRETGLLAPAGDVAVLANNLRRLLGDGELRQRMGVAARARVTERHGMKAAATILDREIRKAVGC